MDYIDILIFLLILLIIFLLMMIYKKYKINSYINNNQSNINTHLPINTNVIKTQNNSSENIIVNDPLPTPFYDETNDEPYDSTTNNDILYHDTNDKTVFIYDKKINNQIENIENELLYAEY